MAVTFLKVAMLVFITSGCTENSNEKPEQTSQQQDMSPLVSPQWLSEHLNDANLVVLDSTVVVDMADGNIKIISGQSTYDQAHIPNARFADLKGDLSRRKSKFDFEMPPAEQFAKAIGDLGIDNNSKVVIYSTDNHVWATRVWWMLKWAGLDQVSVLDGGIKAWVKEGRPVTTEASKFASKVFTLHLRPEIIADKEEVLKAINNDQVIIIDALPQSSYSGDYSMYARAGHITSAINIPSSSLINESGQYLPDDELEMMLDTDKNHRQITYCGGGVAATGVAFNLHRAGYKNVAVYMGSLQEWTAIPENPMSTEE